MGVERLASTSLLGVLALMIAGCATHLPRETGEPERTIAVSESELGLAPDVRLTLENLGWKLVAYEPETVSGVSESLAERARYRLDLVDSRVGTCWLVEGHYAYRMQLIDNASGDTAFSLQGSGCEGSAINRIKNGLRREGFAPEQP